MVVLFKESSSASSTFVAALLLICYALVVPIVLIRVIYTNREILHELKMIKRFGTIYSGRRVIDLLA